MSKALGMRCVWGLCGVLVSVWALASVTQAEVSTDVSGSVLVFPKVIWTGVNATDGGPSRDTVIQLSNTSNNMVHAHCFYVNGQTFQGQPIWQVTDFTIWLTRQQPTHWVASAGRFVNPSDSFGSDGAGQDPGAIPPVPPGFSGELKCIQIDASGVPFGGNNLKGEALIRSADGDVSKSNAVAILANPDLAAGDPANTLLLDNTPIHDGEYNACPNTLLLDHFVDGATDPVISSLNPIWCSDDECPIRTYLTLVPCSQDFENQEPAEVTVQFAIVNELEQVFSASDTVTCWETWRLADIDAPTGRCTQGGDVCLTDQQCIDDNAGFCEKQSVFSLGLLGSGTAFTRISPVDLDGGVLAVAEEVHFNNLSMKGTQVSNRGTAAWNLQQAGNRYDATETVPGGPVVDAIVIPDPF
ncbi:MAG: hypothetical protein ACRERC_02540 [Candidatus Binatia bacterium]